MKVFLSFKHLIVIFAVMAGAVPSTLATPLCSQVLQSLALSPQKIEASLLDLATLKIQIDQAQSEGRSTLLHKEAIAQFRVKKIELQKALDISDREMNLKLREQIARLQQEKSKEATKAEKVREIENKILRPWVKRNTITLDQGVGFYRKRNAIADKHDIAIFQNRISGNELMVVNLKTGKSESFETQLGLSELYVQRNGDRVVLIDFDMGFSAFNFITKTFEPWTELNQWNQSVGFSPKQKPLRKASTLSVDGKNFIWVAKDPTDISHVVVVDIASGKIISKHELPDNPWFNFATMLDANTLLLNGAADFHTYNLISGEYKHFENSSSNGAPTFLNNGQTVVGQDKRWIYRFDIKTGDYEYFDMEHTNGYLGADNTHAWYITYHQEVARVRISDFSTEGLELLKPGQDFSVHPLHGNLVLGNRLLKDQPTAIYDSLDPSVPVFDFKGAYAKPGIRFSTSTVGKDGKMILIEYYDNDVRKIEVWEDQR